MEKGVFVFIISLMVNESICVICSISVSVQCCNGLVSSYFLSVATIGVLSTLYVCQLLGSINRMALCRGHPIPGYDGQNI